MRKTKKIPKLATASLLLGAPIAGCSGGGGGGGASTLEGAVTSYFREYCEFTVRCDSYDYYESTEECVTALRSYVDEYVDEYAQYSAACEDAARRLLNCYAAEMADLNAAGSCDDSAFDDEENGPCAAEDAAVEAACPTDDDDI